MVRVPRYFSGVMEPIMPQPERIRYWELSYPGWTHDRPLIMELGVLFSRDKNQATEVDGKLDCAWISVTHIPASTSCGGYGIFCSRLSLDI